MLTIEVRHSKFDILMHREKAWSGMCQTDTASPEGPADLPIEQKILRKIPLGEYEWNAADLRKPCVRSTADLMQLKAVHSIRARAHVEDRRFLRVFNEAIYGRFIGRVGNFFPRLTAGF